MRLSLKFYPKLSQEQLNIIEELSFHTTKLYNIANYENVSHGYRFYVDMQSYLKDNWHREYLHSHTYQQCLKVLEQDWKSFFSASKDYNKNPNKYSGKPQMPWYKNGTRKNQVIFTNFAIRSKGNTIILSLSQKMQKLFGVKSLNLILPKSVLERMNKSLHQIRCCWDISKKIWYMIIICKQEEVKLPEDYFNTMAIDLGLDNLCACTFLHSEEQYLLSGKSLKSKNSYYNKEIARLTRIQMKGTGSKNFKRTNKMKTLQIKRNNTMNDGLHKASKYVVDLAITHKCHTIVIGDIKGIKKENNSKSFVQIPIQRMVTLIKYKAELNGIKIELINEAYTSGVSAFDLEPIDKASYNIKRRINRGLFVSEGGHYVNSDINGSLNIMRKYESKVLPMPIRRLRDNGCLDQPVRILIA